MPILYGVTIIEQIQLLLEPEASVAEKEEKAADEE